MTATEDLPRRCWCGREITKNQFGKWKHVDGDRWHWAHPAGNRYDDDR